MLKQFFLHSIEIYAEIKLNMLETLKYHKWDEVDSLKKALNRDIVQLTKKLSDQTSQISSLRHVLSTYESGENSMPYDEVLIKIK